MGNTPDHEPSPSPGGTSGPDQSAPDDKIFRLIVENAVDMIVRGDANRNRTYVSPSCREVLGYEPAEMLGKHGFDLVHPEDRSHVQEVFARLGCRIPCIDCTFRMRRKDGTYVWIDGRYRHLSDDDGVLAVLRDVTAQKRAEFLLAEAYAELEKANRTLRDLANRDGLTGLANRRRFDEALDVECRRASREALPLGLVMVDADHFKGYNDRYGHTAGDDCLQRISRAVHETLQRPGDLAARYGGEEIVALLPATDLLGALEVGERIRAAVDALRIEHLSAPYGFMTISAGAGSIFPDGTASGPRQLIDAADKALYQAKAGGRNRVCGMAATPKPVQRQAAGSFPEPGG